jgi:cell fate regulator YaaT (PSP1 superfamily)
MDEQPAAHSQVIVGIRLRRGGPIHDFSPGPLRLRRDDAVLVETEQGSQVGTVVAIWNARRPTAPLARVIKKADARDLGRRDRVLQRERDLHRTVLGLVHGRGVPAKLVKVEIAADGTWATVFVSTEERLDLRDFGREVADALQTRVEVKQVGARDGAKATGGVGICGRELCCSSWLRAFEPVTVKMVKEQGLSVTPSKLAGQCGRLKCCLRYEYQTYRELRRDLPGVGKRVTTVKGDGKVLRQKILGQTVIVSREDDGVEVEVTLDDLVTAREST